jgi:hypothetical protein
MKRIEVKLSISVVAPLLDVLKGLAYEPSEQLEKQAPKDVDSELREVWNKDLLENQKSEMDVLFGLFNEQFFVDGSIILDPTNAEPVLRASAMLRLKLRETVLSDLTDEDLEAGHINLETLADEVVRAFMGYLFLATIQELVIKHIEGRQDEA